MSPDLLAKVILAIASVCLVLIAVGLAGAVVWVSTVEADWERER